jgi:4-phytase/acid phosphatase
MNRGTAPIVIIVMGAISVLGAGCRGVRDTELTLALVVSRHSIRSPTESEPPLAALSTRPEGWPEWPPPADKPGYLTARGKRRAARLGAYYRELYAAEGLLPPAPACPAPGESYFYADVDERTIETSNGLIDGFFEGAATAACGVSTHSLPQSVDPLFHPQVADVCAIDVEAARRDILAAVGGDPSSLARRAAGELEAVERASRCCEASVCGDAPATAAPGACTLLQIPAEIKPSPKRKTISLTGPVSAGAFASETFQLEYADGMPAAGCASERGAPCVAWGALDEAGLRAVMRLRKLSYEVTERTATLARAGGSNLASQILKTLEQGASGRAVPGALPPPTSRFVAIVGHDTNQVNLSGMLGLHWKLDGYEEDDPAPAGALVFELRRSKKTGQQMVRLYYLSQSLTQMRLEEELSLRHPPERARVVVPGCGEGDCPFETFQSVMRAAIDPRCVGPQAAP